MKNSGVVMDGQIMRRIEKQSEIIDTIKCRLQYFDRYIYIYIMSSVPGNSFYRRKDDFQAIGAVVEMTCSYIRWHPLGEAYEMQVK